MDHASGLVFRRPQAASHRRAVVYFCSAVLTQIWQRPILAAIASLVLLAVGGVTVWSLTRPAPEPPAQVARFVIPLAADQTFTNPGRRQVEISPDGDYVAYNADGGLWLRQIDQLQASAIPGAEGGRPQFFSPDGQWLGFWAGGELKKLATSGGAPVTLCTADLPFGVSWGDDEMILYGQGPDGIWRVPGTGGTPEQVIAVEEGEQAHGPQTLPGDEWVLFTFLAGSAQWDQAQIVVQSLVTDERVVLIEGGRDARYLPTGHLVYALDGVLLAVPIDLGSRRVIGGPVPLLEDVAHAPNQTGATHFSVADNGSLVYVPGGPGAIGTRTLVWVDREGREGPLGAPPRTYVQPRISPDGTRVVIDVRDQEQDLWIWDLTRETLTRFTFDLSQDWYPVWTPNGQRIAFSSFRTGGFPNMFWKAADGTGEAEPLAESPNVQFPHGFSPDGTRLLFRETNPGTETDLVVLSMEGDRSTEPLLATEFNERNPELSPDGRWVAYESDASGLMEIYVRPFSDAGQGGLSQISTSGGTQSLWAPNGQELFYRSAGGLMVVPVETDPSFTAGNPQVVVEDLQYHRGGAGRTYDIVPDGQRFLFVKEGVGQASEGQSGPQLIFVENWFQELTERVPTN